MLVWNKWVDLDETVSTKVSIQLSQHPFFRKTSTEIYDDVEKSVEDTRIWKFGKVLSDKLHEIYDMLLRSKDGESKGSFINRQSPIFSSVTKNPILVNFMQILIFSILLRQPVAISATKPPNQIEIDINRSLVEQMM